ncbi:hypothetical protein F4861DRAFT_428046 [Xylaria intraflava]|nr:hypothetical protein F4861DRAFT_428046 [Xylaria intraflava]
MDSNMDFTMQHSNHHPHYHHPSGASSAGSAARCPALRAAAEQRNYQLPTISPARGAAQYDSVHSHPGNRNVWQSRSPQAWRPAMVSPPFAQDSMMMGTFSGPATASNQSSPSEQPCPLSNIPHMQNAPEPYAPPMPSFQQFRTTMHPVPRLLTQPAYSSPGGYASSSPSSQSNSQHFSNRPVHRAEAGLPASASVNSMPIAQTPVSGPSANSGHMSQTTPFNNENNNPGPGPQLPNIPHIFAHQNHPTSFSQQTPQPTAQSSSAEQNASRLAPNSFSPPASTASQQTNDQPTRMISPVEIRRASTAAMNRARRSMPRFTTTPSEWIGENAILFRRGEMSLMEFVENYPGTISDGEGPMNAHRFWRGNGSGKRVASKQALSSLQSVNMADLPESERNCLNVDMYLVTTALRNGSKSQTAVPTAEIRSTRRFSLCNRVEVIQISDS